MLDVKMLFVKSIELFNGFCFILFLSNAHSFSPRIECAQREIIKMKIENKTIKNIELNRELGDRLEYKLHGLLCNYYQMR